MRRPLVLLLAGSLGLAACAAPATAPAPLTTQSILLGSGIHGLGGHRFAGFGHRFGYGGLGYGGLDGGIQPYVGLNAYSYLFPGNFAPFASAGFAAIGAPYTLSFAGVNALCGGIGNIGGFPGSGYPGGVIGGGIPWQGGGFMPPGRGFPPGRGPARPQPSPTPEAPTPTPEAPEPTPEAPAPTPEAPAPTPTPEPSPPEGLPPAPGS